MADITDVTKHSHGDNSIADNDISGTCNCHHDHKAISREVLEKMPSAEDTTSLANLFKLFGDPTRLKILLALEQHEMCVDNLAEMLGVTKSAVSHQLKDLRLANLVKNRREGTTIFYSLADEHVKLIIDVGMEHINE